MKEIMWNTIQGKALDKRLYKLDVVSYTTIKVLEVSRLSKTLYLIKTKVMKEIVEPAPPQFIMLWIPGFEAIPMSISRFHSNELWFIVKPVGDTTRRLVNSNYGEYLGIYGPLGRRLVPKGSSFLLLAGGSGLASITHYLTKLCSDDKYCRVVYGAWSIEEVGDIPGFIKELGGDAVTVCMDQGCDYRGLIGEYIERENLDRYDYIIACGPLEMLRDLTHRIGEEYWSRTIFVMEAHVKCGLGLCGSCYVFPNSSLHLCIDGPGFYLNEIVEKLRG